MLTPKQAQRLCDALDLDDLLENEEEIELLKVHNPELLAAYQALHRLAVGSHVTHEGRQIKKRR